MRRGPLGANVAAERRLASSSGQKSKRPAVSRPRVRRKRFARLPSGIFLSWHKNMLARSYVSLIEDEEIGIFKSGSQNGVGWPNLNVNLQVTCFLSRKFEPWTPCILTVQHPQIHIFGDFVFFSGLFLKYARSPLFAGDRDQPGPPIAKICI